MYYMTDLGQIILHQEGRESWIQRFKSFQPDYGGETRVTLDDKTRGVGILSLQNSVLSQFIFSRS